MTDRTLTEDSGVTKSTGVEFGPLLSNSRILRELKRARDMVADQG